MNLIKCDSQKTKPLEFEGEKGQVWILTSPSPPLCPTFSTCTHSPLTQHTRMHLYTHPHAHTHTHSLAHRKRKQSGRHLISSIILVTVVINVKWFLFTTQIARLQRQEIENVWNVLVHVRQQGQTPTELYCEGTNVESKNIRNALAAWVWALILTIRDYLNWQFI